MIMIKKHYKGITIGILCIIVLASILSLLPTQKKVKEVSKKQIIPALMITKKGMDTIRDATDNSFEKLYFGSEGTFQWNILNQKETGYQDATKTHKDTILVISDDLFDPVIFDEQTNIYQNSQLRKQEIALANKVLSSKEKIAVLQSTKQGGEIIKGGSYVYEEPELVGDLFFAPTAAIMNTPKYGLSERHSRQEKDYFWLSSIRQGRTKEVGYISKCGVFASLSIDTPISFRAVANIDISKIAFIQTVNGKVSGPLGQEALLQVEQKQAIDGYCLTIKDESQHLGIESVTNNGDEITVHYQTLGQGNRLSAIVMDETNMNILYYGQIKDISTIKNGQATIAIPKEIDLQKHHLYLFSEQYYGNNKTDFCSELVEIGR